MRRTVIYGVRPEDLEKYSLDHYDARLQLDGTYTMVPLMWTNQAEFMEYAFGTGEEWDE